MSHRSNGKPIHAETLKPSTPDCRELSKELESRFLIVCELHGRISGGRPLPIPKDMQQHFVRWRQVVVRHRNGDFRNSVSEWQSMKEVAQFVLDWGCKLRGQPQQKLVWSE